MESFNESSDSAFAEESYKVIFIGDSSVGKTSIIKRFFEESFTEDTQPTLAWAQKSKKVPVGPKSPDGEQQMIKLDVWDTAGQEKFRNITRGYYKVSAGVAICFDLTDIASF